MAASPVFEPNKVLHVSGACTTQPGELDSTTPYGFLGHNTSVGGCLIDVQALKREYPKAKKVAIVTPDDGAIPYLVPKLKKIFELNGYTVVGETVGYPNEMVDYSPIGAKLNAIKDADAIFMKNGAPQSGASIIKALRQLGNNKPFVCSILTAGTDLLGIMGKEVATNVIAVGLDPNAPNNPSLVNEIFKRSGEKPPIFLLVPNSLWVLTKVIQAADSLDPAVVKAKWESMDKVDTLFGTGIMCGDQTYGIKHHAVSHPWAYQKIMGGKVSFGPWLAASVIP
jgi:ABC-type branched-subunit amino acid transport system substrate-binding protein